MSVNGEELNIFDETEDEYIDFLDNEDERYNELVLYYNEKADLLNREKEIYTFSGPERYRDLALYDDDVEYDREKEPIDDISYNNKMNKIEKDRAELKNRIDAYNSMIELIKRNIDKIQDTEESISEYAKALNNNRLKYGLEGKLKQMLNVNREQLPEVAKNIVDQPNTEKPTGGKSRKSKKSSRKTRKNKKSNKK